MFIARACGRAFRGRGGRISAPSSRAYAASAVLPLRRADGVQHFLAQPTQYALLPTPLPVDCTSEANEYWFSNSTTQELMAVVAACIHDLYDVPRAKGIFDRLRTTTSAAMETRVVNAMLGAYLNIAARGEAEYWIESLWELFDAMQQPSTGSYAIMLLAIHRFPDYAVKSFNDILSAAVTHEIPLTNLVSDRAFSDDDEALQIISELSKAAIQLNLPTALEALGEAQTRGSQVQD